MAPRVAQRFERGRIFELERSQRTVNPALVGRRYQFEKSYAGLGGQRLIDIIAYEERQVLRDTNMAQQAAQPHQIGQSPLYGLLPRSITRRVPAGGVQ